MPKLYGPPWMLRLASGETRLKDEAIVKRETRVDDALASLPPPPSEKIAFGLAAMNRPPEPEPFFSLGPGEDRPEDPPIQEEPAPLPPPKAPLPVDRPPDSFFDIPGG